jgi:hypothetical protein
MGGLLSLKVMLKSCAQKKYLKELALLELVTLQMGVRYNYFITRK